MAAQTPDGSAHRVVWRAGGVGFPPLSSPRVCVTRGEIDILKFVGVDSYEPLEGSNNVKEPQCHIYQRRLPVRARQRCWHLNTTRWVRRPFRCHLPDKRPCSYRWVVTSDCHLVTEEKGHRMHKAREERSAGIPWMSMFPSPRGEYSIGTITPVNSGKISTYGDEATITNAPRSSGDSFRRLSQVRGCQSSSPFGSSAW